MENLNSAFENEIIRVLSDVTYGRPNICALVDRTLKALSNRVNLSFDDPVITMIESGYVVGICFYSEEKDHIVQFSPFKISSVVSQGTRYHVGKSEIVVSSGFSNPDAVINTVSKEKIKMRPDILIGNNNYFNFLNPDQNNFDINIIAHALSNICRFGGHCKRFYSVAQHSLMVSYICPPEYALEGLLHDAAEAFTGDIPSPLKQLLPDYKALEKSIESSVFKKLGVTIPDCIKHYDLMMLATEQRDLMPPHDDSWAIIADIPPLLCKLKPLPPEKAKELFLKRFHELKKRFV